jgi:hypothetical protein
MGLGNMHPRGQGFFLFWRSVLDFVVPIKFSMGFQHAPNSCSFYPISFALGFDSCTNIKCPTEDITIYSFWESPKLEFYYYYGPIKDAHHKRKEK